MLCTEIVLSIDLPNVVTEIVLPLYAFVLRHRKLSFHSERHISMHFRKSRLFPGPLEEPFCVFIFYTHAILFYVVNESACK